LNRSKIVQNTSDKYSIKDHRLRKVRSLKNYKEWLECESR